MIKTRETEITYDVGKYDNSPAGGPHAGQYFIKRRASRIVAFAETDEQAADIVEAFVVKDRQT